MSSKRNRARSYEFVRNTKEPIKGFTVKGKKLAFGKSGIMMIHDKALADDINKQYGCTRTGSRQVIMSDVPSTRGWEPGRRTFWGGVPEMPWKKEKGDGKEKMDGEGVCQVPRSIQAQGKEGRDEYEGIRNEGDEEG